MLTKTGAKLLDFGLAKVRAAEAAAGMTALPTQTTPLTGEGAILGTLQYMAPEHLEGAEADARTDIFAFGAVIYEMATGRKAFAGKSQASVISAIMTAEPPLISTLQPLAPAALDHVVRVCLAKDPDARWQTAHDVLVELKWIAEAGSQASVPKLVAARRKSWHLLSWALTAVVSIAFLVLTVVHFSGRPGQAHLARFLVPIPEKLNLEWFDGPAVSPDGQKFVFAALVANGRRLLWIRSLDAVAAEPLAGTEGGFSPFWSPDSRFVAFFTVDNKLKKTEASAGAVVQTICEASAAPPGAWSPDGVILFTAQKGLRSVSAAGGEVTAALELDLARQESAQTYPSFLPDGRHFLFFSQSADPGKSGTYVGTLGSKETRLLIPGDSNAQYVLPGFLIYGRGETVVAQPFDATKLRLTGEPLAIGQQVRRLSQAPGSMFSVSNTGLLVYRNLGSTNFQLAWHGRDGSRLQPVGEPGGYREMALSPDQTRLALERTDPQTGLQNIWILELATGILSRLTFVSTNDSDLVWSPDGREAVFTSTRKGQDLYRKTVSGGEEELLFQSGEAKYAYQWLKGGKAILFLNDNGKTFYQLPLIGERKPLVLLKSQFDKDGLSVSSDERWAAYSSLESGRWEVYVAAFPTFTEKRQISNKGGCQPVWRKDGKELFYLALDGKLMVAEVKAGPLTTGVPQALFQTSLRVDPTLHQYNVAADGKKFIIGERINEGVEQFTVVLNWAAGLKR
jgi:eukaryotic-like serine/threonine-protein kinase